MNCLSCEIIRNNENLQLNLSNGDNRDNSFAIQDDNLVNIIDALSSDQQIIFGVHPEDVLVKHQSVPNSFKAEVYSVEPLGADTIVEITLGTDETSSHTILKSVTAPDFEAEIGNFLYVSFVSDRIHLFDKTTEKTLMT